MIPFFFWLNRLVLVGHFGNELDTYQPNFFFGIITSQFTHGIIDVVGSRFLELIIDVEHVVFIHYVFQEIIDIQFGARINDSFYFIKQFIELDALRYRYII